jgi:hypothetical protein
LRSGPLRPDVGRPPNAVKAIIALSNNFGMIRLWILNFLGPDVDGENNTEHRCALSVLHVGSVHRVIVRTNHFFERHRTPELRVDDTSRPLRSKVNRALRVSVEIRATCRLSRRCATAPIEVIEIEFPSMKRLINEGEFAKTPRLTVLASNSIRWWKNSESAISRMRQRALGSTTGRHCTSDNVSAARTVALLSPLTPHLLPNTFDECRSSKRRGLGFLA